MTSMSTDASLSVYEICSKIVTKRLENPGWPSYWTQCAQSAFNFAEDNRECVLFVDKNMILVYTFLEDAVLSVRNEENSLENISYFQVK